MAPTTRCRRNVQDDDSDNDNKNAKDPRDPAIDLDAHRGLRAQRETARRRNRSDVRASQDAVRENQASLEKSAGIGRTLLSAVGSCQST